MAKKQIVYTKASLIKKLKQIAKKGWIPNARHGNHGGVGNTLEDLLGIKENNLPIANAAEWELKTQRLGKNSRAGSLCTLLHMEPSPRALGFVPKVFLPKYGWAHQEAGKRYKKGEMSFRQTIHGARRSDRGFKVVVDRKNPKVLISFDAKSSGARHKKWLASVKKRVGLRELNPQPYWGFDDLKHKAGTKLLNSFYVTAEVQRKNGKEYYKYSKVMMLKKFSFEKFLKALEQGKVFVDFDSRTGHNHGTKFRTTSTQLPMLYEKVIKVV
jgi:hypothetical protein